MPSSKSGMWVKDGRLIRGRALQCWIILQSRGWLVRSIDVVLEGLLKLGVGDTGSGLQYMVERDDWKPNDLYDY